MAVGIDTTNPSAVPANLNPGYIFGYLDGRWQTYEPLKQKFPNAIPVSITVSGNLAAQCCDCESGDLTPAQAGTWARAKVAAGLVPAVYCSEAAWSEVKTAVGNIPCDWWIAAYPGPGPVLYSGSVAHQWIDRGTYDQSVVLDGWEPGRLIYNPPPIPVSDLPIEGEDMTSQVIGTQKHVWGIINGQAVHWWQDSAYSDPFKWFKEILP